MSKQAGGERWSKYSPEFKRAAVDRMVAGESPTAIARELSIRWQVFVCLESRGKRKSGRSTGGGESRQRSAGARDRAATKANL